MRIVDSFFFCLYCSHAYTSPRKINAIVQRFHYSSSNPLMQKKNKKTKKVRSIHFPAHTKTYNNWVSRALKIGLNLTSVMQLNKTTNYKLSVWLKNHTTSLTMIDICFIRFFFLSARKKRVKYLSLTRASKMADTRVR